MLTFGSGSAGALGHGNTHYVLTPTPVGAFTHLTDHWGVGVGLKIGGSA